MLKVVQNAGNEVHELGESLFNSGLKRLYKLCVNTLSLPQVVFATFNMGIISSFVRSLSVTTPHTYTQQIYVFNRGVAKVFHIIHRTNSSYYKGELNTL